MSIATAKTMKMANRQMWSVSLICGGKNLHPRPNQDYIGLYTVFNSDTLSEEELNKLFRYTIPFQIVC